MNKVYIYNVLEADINFYRSRAEYYESNHLFEASSCARKLADNLELAMTTLPTGKDTAIA